MKDDARVICFDLWSFSITNIATLFYTRGNW